MSTAMDFTSPAGTQLFADTAPSVLGLIRSNMAAQATMFVGSSFTGLIDGTIRVDSTFTKFQKSLSGTFSDMPMTNILGFVAAPLAGPALTGAATLGGNPLATTNMLTAYAPLASPPFTGTISGVNESLSGTLGVTGLASFAGGLSVTAGTATFAGTVNASGAMNVTGQLTLSTGTTTGKLTGATGNAGVLQLLGGATSSTAYINLCGDSYASTPGAVVIGASTLNFTTTGAFSINALTNVSLNGDLCVARNSTSGACYFGTSKSAYWYFDGTNMSLGGSAYLLAGAIVRSSDARWKTQRRKVKLAEAKNLIKNIDAEWFKMKGTKSGGLIAQEVEKQGEFGKRFVIENEDGYKSVDYEGVLVCAVLPVLKDLLQRAELT